MAARKTVTPNTETINVKIKECGWSNAYFTGTLMGKGRGWTTEWKRGACYPSPEEAAQMCALLNTTPEEILTKPEDIELVAGLIAQEREKSIKKDLPEEVDEITQALLDFAKNGTPEQKEDALQYIQFLKSKRPKD